jgi:UPF0716 protein FxsA
MRLLLLLLLPFLELWLMIKIGAEVGALAVIVWLVAMIFVGVNLLRYLGASSMLRAAQDVRSGGAMPAQTLADGLFKAIGAVLLIIPGFITDVMALLCFIPLVRRLFLKRWLAKMAVNVSKHGFKAAGFGADAFKSGPFGSSAGNVYEHQGTSQPESEPVNKGVLIEQQPDSPPSQERKND